MSLKPDRKTADKTAKINSDGVLCAVLRSCETRAELVVCGRAVMRDARQSLFIFAVLSAVLRSGFRDTVAK